MLVLTALLLMLLLLNASELYTALLLLLLLLCSLLTCRTELLYFASAAAVTAAVPAVSPLPSCEARTPRMYSSAARSRRRRSSVGSGLLLSPPPVGERSRRCCRGRCRCRRSLVRIDDVGRARGALRARTGRLLDLERPWGRDDRMPWPRWLLRGAGVR